MSTCRHLVVIEFCVPSLGEGRKVYIGMNLFVNTLRVGRWDFGYVFDMIVGVDGEVK